ncbi:MAG: hypothetical protein COA52_18715 [Hyphomicrobiales bacterium]|nr:MAG: hypothetical protein COA52_18715 [Hyphomicrobiales bacterium]
MATHPNLDDFKYFFAERFNIQKNVPPEEALIHIVAMLPNIGGQGVLKCSPQSSKRLLEIARRGLKSSNYANQLSIDSVHRELRKLVVEWFINLEKPINPSNTDKIVSKAIKNAATNLKTAVYYFPCHINFVETPANFSFGPVSFQTMSSFKKQFEAKTEAFIEGGRKTKQVQVRRNLDKRLRSDFRTFSWVACVEVSDCEASLAEVKARSVVTSSMHFIQALLGYKESEEMIVGGTGIVPNKQSHLVENVDGTIAICWQNRYHANEFSADWWENLNSEGRDYFITGFGKVLSLELGNLSTPPLVTRLIDAAAWYSEGIRDTHPASRTIKFVTSIERIISSGESKCVTKSVTERTAALLLLVQDKSFEVIKKEMSVVYDIRSSYVHGTRSPKDIDFKKCIESAEWLSRCVLWAALQFFEDGLEVRDYEITKLDKSFNRLVDWAKNAKSDV